MKHILAVAVVILFASSIASSQLLKYYIDADSGNDGNDGKSPATAWQSLAKVNSRTFLGGDSLLFKSGAVWTGQLKPKGSGRAGQPIVVASYGGTERSVIHGGGVTGEATVYLYNQQYWDVTDLEITNDAAVAGDRRGVLIAASNFGVVRHIHLKNLFIHNVKGIVDQSSDAAKRTGGIGIETVGDNVVATRFDDVLIEGCTIAFCENTGLYTDNLVNRSDYPNSSGWLNRRFTGVQIRNNVIHHISKNAMILRLFDGGAVEHNVCYETALRVTGNTMYTISSSGTVFQFNEGYLNRATENDPNGGDGSMYDADLRSVNIVFQYSYSHDNSHGLLWNCTVQNDSGIICRYNISQNDRGIIFCVNYPVTSLHIYNNTVYIGAGLSPVIISERNVNSGTRLYSFRNNVIYNLSPSASYDFRSAGYIRVFANNVFYGYHPSDEPADPGKLTSDPRFVSPGSGSIGRATVDGYKLQKESPCIDSGVLVPGHATQDFWGNAVPAGTAVDRGAYEYLPDPNGVNDDVRTRVSRYALLQNFPNPFNPTTVVRYEVPAAGDVRLTVYDILGQDIATLFEGPAYAGVHSVQFNGERLPSGTYFYTLHAGSYTDTKRMVLIR